MGKKCIVINDSNNNNTCSSNINNDTVGSSSTSSSSNNNSNNNISSSLSSSKNDNHNSSNSNNNGSSNIYSSNYSNSSSNSNSFSNNNGSSSNNSSHMVVVGSQSRTFIPGLQIYKNCFFVSAYARAAKILFDMAKSAPPLSRQDYPIWGTCLGFEQLAVLTANPSPGANSSSLLTACDSENQRGSVRVKRRREWRRSDIGRDMPRNVFRVLEGADRPIFNSHHKCLTPGAFHSQSLGRFWRLLATDFDKNGLEFVTLMEAKGGLPIWGSQFHPEKPLFEWAERLDQLPHDRAAVQVSSTVLKP